MSDRAAGLRRVFVFGSANRDHTLTVDELPQAGQTILARSYSAGFGGKGANQAIAAATAEGRVAFVGAVGVDDESEAVLSNLAGLGIDTGWISRIDAEPTGRAFVLVDTHGANEIVVAAGANAALGFENVEDALSAVESDDVLVVQCEIPLIRVEQVISGGASRGALVILNLAPFTALPQHVLGEVGLLVVNESEARALVPAVLSSTDLATAVVGSLGCACIVTLGEQGSVYAAPDGTALAVPAMAVDSVVDTTGAGDVYVGTLAASLANYDDIATAMATASVAAARSVSTPGAQAPAPKPATETVG